MEEKIMAGKFAKWLRRPGATFEPGEMAEVEALDEAGQAALVWLNDAKVYIWSMFTALGAWNDALANGDANADRWLSKDDPYGMIAGAFFAGVNFHPTWGELEPQARAFLIAVIMAALRSAFPSR